MIDEDEAQFGTASHPPSHLGFTVLITYVRLPGPVRSSRRGCGFHPFAGKCPELMIAGVDARTQSEATHRPHVHSIGNR